MSPPRLKEYTLTPKDSCEPKLFGLSPPDKEEAHQYVDKPGVRLNCCCSPKMMRGEVPIHPQTHPSFMHRRIARNPEFRLKLEQMALNLSPLVQITTGNVHPCFPRTVLHYWLLTDGELEDMASFYHQRTPSRLKYQYPCPIAWRPDLPLEEKRRKMGKFIGLRGCETPIWHKTEEEIAEEARQARIAAEEEMWQRKEYPRIGGGV